MWWEILGLPGLGDSISTDPERTALRRQGEEPGSIEVWLQCAVAMQKCRFGAVTGWFYKKCGFLGVIS